MKFLLILMLISSTNIFAQTLNAVEKEVIVTIDGKALTFSQVGTQKVSIADQEVDVAVSYSPYKTFNNYGVSFQLPAKASAYLDESNQDFDIWNIDYDESLFLFFVYKNSQIDITEEFVKTQLQTMASSMNMEIDEPRSIQYKNTDIKVLNTTGYLGKYKFMVEQFGFKNDQHIFVVFGYAPLKDHITRRVDRIYVKFKKLFFSSLKY